MEVLPREDSPGSATPGVSRFVPLRTTRLEGRVSGPLAEFTVTHTYEFSSEVCSLVVEALYRFPLPGDAAVTGVTVAFGEVTISTELVDRETAETRYQAAKNEGRQAVLLTRESPDVFTLSVSGLRPDERVTVTTRYVQLARPLAYGWSLRIPLTTAPRYTRTDELNRRHAQGQPLTVLRDPGHTLSARVTFDLAESVASPTHALAIERAQGQTEVRLADGELIPDRDLVFEWQLPQDNERIGISALVHTDEEFQYFMALLTPPVEAATTSTAREVILLVDRSGSMHGPKWQAADWAVKRFLSGLTDRDAFTLGLFHNTVRWFSRDIRTGNMAAVNDAFEFLDAHRDSGGTELGVALEQALQTAREPGERSRHVLIVTDAEVSDAGRILRLADQEQGRPDRRRISVLCIDAAPNSYLAHELAERGGGVARFLTSDPAEGDIATMLDELLGEWARPIASGLSLLVNRPVAHAIGHRVTANTKDDVAIDIGDLPAQRSRWVAGRVPRDANAPLELALITPSGQQLAHTVVDPAGTGSSNPVLRALFGAHRVTSLEELSHAYVDPGDIEFQLTKLGLTLPEIDEGSSSLYPENRVGVTNVKLRRLLVNEALAAGIACSETAFVAHRQEAGARVQTTAAVPNALPQGWDQGFVSAAEPSIAQRLFSRAAPSLASDQAQMDVPFMATLRAPGGCMSQPRKKRPVKVFSGVPQFSERQAVLFDSERHRDKLPDNTRLTQLTMELGKGAVSAEGVDILTLLIYVGDLVSPRARLRLSDLLRQQGSRPLNILRRSGERVLVVLKASTSPPQTATALSILITCD